MAVIAGLLVAIVLAQFIDGRVALVLGLVIGVIVFVLLKRRTIDRTRYSL